MAKINTIFSFQDGVSNPLSRMAETLKNVTGNMGELAAKCFEFNQVVQAVQIGLSAMGKVAGSLKPLINEAAMYEGLLARLSVALGDASTAQEYFVQIQNFAKQTPFDVKGATDAFILLKNAGFEAEELLDTISMIGDLAQGNNQAFNNMAFNLMQIKANGKATAMDIRQFGTFGVPMLAALKEIGREGDMTFDAVYAAMQHLTEEGGKFYNSMNAGAATFAGGAAQLGDALSQLKASLGNAFLPAVHNMQGVLAQGLTNIREYFESLTVYIDENGQKVNIIAEYFERVMERVVGALPTIISGVALLATALIGVGAALLAIKVIADPTGALIRLAIVGVLTLIGEIGMASNEANEGLEKTCGMLQASVGILGTVVGTIVGIVYDAYAVVYNLLAGSWNAWVTIANSLVLLFKNPIDGIKLLFIGLGEYIVNLISAMAGLIDMVFNTRLTEAINETGDRLRAARKEIELENKAPFHAVNNFKDITGVAAFTLKGAEFGAGLGQTIDDAIRGFDKNSELIKAAGAMDKLAGKFPALNTDGSGALVVADKNNVAIADDYRTLIATRSDLLFGNQFASYEPKVIIENVEVTDYAMVDELARRVAAELAGEIRDTAAGKLNIGG